MFNGSIHKKILKVDKLHGRWKCQEDMVNENSRRHGHCKFLECCLI